MRKALFAFICGLLLCGNSVFGEDNVYDVKVQFNSINLYNGQYEVIFGFDNYDDNIENYNQEIIYFVSPMDKAELSIFQKLEKNAFYKINYYCSQMCYEEGQAYPVKIEVGKKLSVSNGKYFIIFSSIPLNKQNAANKSLNAYIKKGLNDVQLINTNEYPNFTNGYWAVVKGPYSLDEAKKIKKEIKHLIPKEKPYIKSGWKK